MEQDKNRKNFSQKKHDRSNLKNAFSKKWWVHHVTKTAFNVAPNYSADWIRLNSFRPQYMNLNAEQKQARELSFETVFKIGKNKKIRMYEWGFGPSILFVHGWAGRGLQFHKFISPLVAAGFSVVTFDHYGHGDSTQGSSSYLDFIHTIKAILNGYDDFYGAIGHSMGASALLKSIESVDYPLKVGLIAPMSDVQEVLVDLQVRKSIYKPLFTEVIHKIEQSFHMTVEEGRTYNYPLLNQHKGLLIHDSRDRINPFARSEEIHAKWQGSQLIATQGLGHSRILTSPEVISQLTQFMLKK